MSVGILFSRLFLDQISSWKSAPRGHRFNFSFCYEFLRRCRYLPFVANTVQDIHLIFTEFAARRNGNERKSAYPSIAEKPY